MNRIATLEVNASVSKAENVTQTTCPYCGVGCGVDAKVTPAVTTTTAATATATNNAVQPIVSVSGDVTHPANFGRLCIKGSNLADTIGLESRVLQPHIGRGQARQATTWDNAIQSIAQKFSECIATHGRDSVALYVSGQLLTEDYYVANKFVKGYIGTANIDTNSRLCMSSAVAAHKRSFGEDVVPASYNDFEYAEMVVLVGSNTAWCHPVLFQRIMQAKSERDVFVVVIDPRYTSTCEQADLHLPVLPGQDVALFNGLLQYLDQHGYTDDDFVQAHTEGLNDALTSSNSESDLHAVAARTGISVDKLEQFYAKFAQTERVMTLFSQGVNQSSQGTFKANSIINCHLLTGKLVNWAQRHFP